MTREEWEESLYEKRIKDQKGNGDFAFDDDGLPEKCDCGRSLNSHDHCPRCDY